MKIPKQVTIGDTKYEVRRTSNDLRLGYISYADHVISISRVYFMGGRMSAYEQADTFWHELTHGILHDMGHRLQNNEQFVTAFAKRLNKAVHSAKF